MADLEFAMKKASVMQTHTMPMEACRSMSADLHASKSPNKNLPVSLTLEHVSPVTRLLEKRKQMLQVQESLDAQKDEYARKEELFKRREENLRKKDLELQESLVLFNKFLKENEQKRRRADHRANDEIKKRLKWEKQILAHKANVQTLREKCDQLKKAVLKNEKYQKYLDKVQDAYSTHFEEISSIITRYQTLKSTNTEMIKLQELLIERNEKARIDFSEYKKKQYNATLSLNNDIASESKELEECVKRTSDVEESMIHREQEMNDEQRISTQIINATENLYHRCRKVLSGIRRHGSQRLNAKQKATMDAVTILKEETCWKLGEIETYLLDFKDIIESIETNERIEANAQAQQLQEARRHKLRMVREANYAYEREKGEAGDRDRERGSSTHDSTSNAMYRSSMGKSYASSSSHAEGHSNYSQSSSMVYKSTNS